MALYGPIYRTLLKMSRSNEFKEQGFACRCCVTDSQIGDLAASVPSPVELVSLVFACPLPRCESERNAGSCRADPTRSARWPARVNLAAFWQQIAPIVPFLPTLPTAKYCTVCYLQIAAHLDTEEVIGSMPIRSSPCTLSIAPQCSSSRYCSPSGPLEPRTLSSNLVSLASPSDSFADLSNAAIASCSRSKIRAGPIASIR